MDYFDPESMKEHDAKKQFEKWYSEQTGIVYDLEEEMLALISPQGNNPKYGHSVKAMYVLDQVDDSD